MSGSTARLACDAASALALFALDPGRWGLCLRAAPGPVVDACLAALRALLPDRSLRRLPPRVADDQLLGGIDLPASLKAGGPILRRGLLADADGHLLMLPSAE